MALLDQCTPWLTLEIAYTYDIPPLHLAAVSFSEKERLPIKITML